MWLVGARWSRRLQRLLIFFLIFLGGTLLIVVLIIHEVLSLRAIRSSTCRILIVRIGCWVIDTIFILLFLRCSVFLDVRFVLFVAHLQLLDLFGIVFVTTDDVQVVVEAMPVGKCEIDWVEANYWWDTWSFSELDLESEDAAAVALVGDGSDFTKG